MNKNYVRKHTLKGKFNMIYIKIEKKGNSKLFSKWYKI